jgi:hypothetical protein
MPAKPKKKTAKKKTTTGAAKKNMAASIAGLGASGHAHSLPLCRDGKHDASCTGKGHEVVCKKVSIGPIKAAMCAHLKI